MLNLIANIAVGALAIALVCAGLANVIRELIEDRKEKGR